jgi:hypothetical protein
LYELYNASLSAGPHRWPKNSTSIAMHAPLVLDIGSNVFISGAPDPRWDHSDLQKLRAIRLADFEVIRMDRIYNP